MKTNNMNLLKAKLKVIFEKNEIKLGVIEQDRREQGRVVLIYEIKREEIKKLMESSYDRLYRNIPKLNNFIKLEHADIAYIEREIQEKRDEFNNLFNYKFIGFQYDENDEITGYVASKAVDAKGKYIPIDTSQNNKLHQARGCLNEQIVMYREFVRNHLFRQIVMLVVFSGVLSGMLRKNIVCSMCGKSSTGKTTIIQFFTAAFGSIECKAINRDFNATENALLKMFEGVRGTVQYIDDFSANERDESGKLKNPTNLMYALEKGTMKLRIGRNNTVEEGEDFATTIIMTAEESILSRCDEKGGIPARIMEIENEENDFFSSAEECERIKKLSSDNYGLVGIEYVSQLLKRHTTSGIKEEYNAELNRLRRLQSEKEHKLLRIQEKIAILTLTAKYLEEIFDIKFDVDKIHNYLLNIIKQKLEERRELNPEKLLVEQFYMTFINFVKENHPEDVEKDGVAIRNSDYNELTGKVGQSYKLSVKKALKKYDLLKVDTGRTYDKNLGKGRGKGIYLLFNEEFMEGAYE